MPYSLAAGSFLCLPPGLRGLLYKLANRTAKARQSCLLVSRRSEEDETPLTGTRASGVALPLVLRAVGSRSPRPAFLPKERLPAT